MARSRPLRAAHAGHVRREAPLDAVSWAVGAAFLVAYAALASPVAGDKDSGEFALVLATRGLAHPTGYPLYTLLGAAFVQVAHALGAAWAHAANLWSALAGGVAMGALHALAARLVLPATGARAAAGLALLPLLAFGFNPMWTVETTLAEVNALHLAWVLLAALVARRALAACARPDTTPRALRGHAVAWGLVVGAGLAHHATSVLFAAPLSLTLGLAVARRGRGAGAALAAGAAAAVVPLASYAWVAWRGAHPVAGQWAELAPGLRGVLDHVTGAQYRGFLGRFAPSPMQQGLLARHVYPWLVPAVLGALATLAARAPGERAWRAALAAGALAQVAWAFGYGVRDPGSYFLPALAVGLALAVAALARVAALRRAGPALALGAGLALLVPAVAGVRATQARNATYAGFDTLLRRMWAGLPPGPAFVVWDDDMASRLRAFQILERAHADVTVVQPRRLTQPEPRRRFVAEFGFDPAAGVTAADLAAAARDEARSQALVEAIVARINEESARPVVLFLPQVPSVRLLKKPAATAP